MHMLKRWFVATMLILCLSLVAVGCAKQGGTGKSATGGPMFMDKASTADVAQFMADAKGKVVLLNVFASWCGYCMQEVPDLVALRGIYPAGELAMLGVSLDDAADLPELQRIIKEMNISYPVYMVGDDYAEKNNITGIPVTIIYDRNGMEYKTILGYVERSEIEKPIVELLNR